MKELTIEEKAKRYSEALERARELSKTVTGANYEYIFPELKESEDDKIRKELIQFIKNWKNPDNIGRPHDFPTLTRNVEQCDRYIAWLEKQGEQSVEPKWCHHKVDLSDCSEEYRRAYYDGWNNCNMQYSQYKSELDDVTKCLINGMKFYYEGNKEATWGTDKWSMPVKHIIEVLEKQSEQKPYGQRKECEDCQFNYVGECKGFCQMKRDEQKPVDKVEPKFHPGDWIIDNEYGDVLKVTKADAKSYEITNQDEEIFNILKEDVERNFRLWTIADAKDGDLIYVSTEEKGIQAIFHKYKNDIIFLHCYLCADFVQGGYIPIGDVELIYPLQKTHYNSFFEKMHKAGYEWDNDKKELKKKIEPKFHPGDWIVDDETPNDVFCVIEVLGEIYKVIDTDGNDYHIPHCKADNQFHLWSINYAKDGDILASELTDSILLFRGIKDNKIDFYCDYDAGLESPYDKFGINDSSEHYGSVEESQDIHPATKEQRDTLIKAMANAEYTFDFDKKELKKVEIEKLNADKVIAWIDEHVPTKFEDMENYVQQFKKDFKL